MLNFEFTYKTTNEYRSDRLSGYIERYKNVRMEVITKDGWHIDFPAHSEEEYLECVDRAKVNGDKILQIYANLDFYEPKDWY